MNKELEENQALYESIVKKMRAELESLESQRIGNQSLTKKAKRSSSEMSIYVDSKDKTKQKCFNKFEEEVNETLQKTIKNLNNLFGDFNDNLKEIKECTLSTEMLWN